MKTLINVEKMKIIDMNIGRYYDDVSCEYIKIMQFNMRNIKIQAILS